MLTEGQADRLFDEAFADWIQRQLDDPSEGVRRSLRRITTRNFGQDVDDDAPIARLKRAGRDLLRVARPPRPWRRPADFDRDGADRPPARRHRHVQSDHASAHQRPRHACIATPSRCAAPGPRCSPARERGFDDYDGWEAALCDLAAAAARPAASGKSTTGQYSKDVPRAQVVTARDLIVDALVAFRDRADADLAALVHEALRRGDRRLRDAQGSAPAPSTSSIC